MEGIGSVTSRIADIQARIASLSPAPVVRVAVPTATTATSATTGPTGATGGTFAATLAGAVAGSATSGATTGTGSTTHLRRADGVPLELAAHGNGRVPASALQTIGRGKHAMWSPAAEAFGRLEAAAARDGVTFGVTDSYRSYDQQVDLARRKGLYSQGGLAARPGTSEHGWGLSLDLDLDGRALTWMRANAARFGFTENVPRESWHWTFTA
ncbi:M15 family metallopeptidase [Kineococcus terrestris]|uniref:M15 family metallopeptidase n=1 Tax=Kineococcus terrestris TaxID=2044856 RepID=UPI0034DB5B03